MTKPSGYILSLIISVLFIASTSLVTGQSSIVLETKDKTVINVKNSFPNFEVSNDGRLIAVTSNVSRIGENRVGGIFIFDALNFKPLGILEGHETVIINIRFSPDGSKLLASQFNKNAVMWDIKTREVINKFPLEKAALFFDINSRGQGLFANFGRSISVYDLNTGEQQQKFKLKSSYVTNVRFAGEDNVLITTNKQFHNYNISTQIFEEKLDLLETTSSVWYSNSISDIQGVRQSYRIVATKVMQEKMRTFIIGDILTLKVVDGKVTEQSEHELDEDFSAKGVLTHPDLQEIYLISNNELRVYDKFWALLYSETVSKKGSRLAANSLTKLTLFNSGKHLAITDLLSLTRIYSVEQRKIVAYLYVTPDNKYAIISPNGNMEGDIEAIEDLQWSDGVNAIGLENTFEAMYSPNLLAQLLVGAIITQEVSLENAINSKPTVRITQIDGIPFNNDTLSFKKKNIEVEINAEGPTDLSEIRLYQNRKLVGIETGLDPGTFTKQVTFNVALTNAYGPNNFMYAKAVNKDGIESDVAKFVIKYLNDEKLKPKLYLLSIGVNEYRNPKYNLNYARPDAESFTKIIKEQTASLFDQVVVFSFQDQDATRENILQAFTDIKLAANDQDLFIFYYAGHGVMSSGDIGKPAFYMVLPAVTKLYGSDQMLIDYAISAQEIKIFSQEINAQKQIYLIDACQSGGALEEFASRGVAEERAIANLARSTGTFWISATGSEQYASEFETLGHGVFTYVLLEGLNGAADAGRSDKQITIRELSAYVESRVPELSEEHKGVPQFPAAYGYGNDFPLMVIELK